MNKQRLKQIENVHTQLFALKRQLDRIMSDEEYAFDNMPEGLQQSANGERSEEAMNNLDDAISHIDEAIDSLNEIM